MQMHFATRCSLGVAAFFCFMGAQTAQAATILVPTGGLLSPDSPAVPAEYGEFGADYNQLITDYFDFSNLSTELVKMGRLEGSYTPTALTVAGHADTYLYQVGGGSISYISGQLGFDLAESAVVRFSLSQSERARFSPNLSLTLRDATGDVALGCVGGRSMGCRAGSQPGWVDAGVSPAGGVELEAGHYELYIAAFSDYSAGIPINADFNFQLTTVPLPGTAWLLVSGLGLLARRRRAVKVG
jgi:hypothetical protein